MDILVQGGNGLWNVELHRCAQDDGIQVRPRQHLIEIEILLFSPESLSRNGQTVGVAVTHRADADRVDGIQRQLKPPAPASRSHDPQRYPVIRSRDIGPPMRRSLLVRGNLIRGILIRGLIHLVQQRANKLALIAFAVLGVPPTHLLAMQKFRMARRLALPSVGAARAHAAPGMATSVSRSFRIRHMFAPLAYNQSTVNLTYETDKAAT